MRARRAYLKSQRRCIDCMTRDAFTEMGRARCAECGERHNASVRRASARRSPEQNRERQRRFVARRLGAGLCVLCGKSLDKGKRLCSRCAAKQNRRAVERRRERGGLDRRSEGVCYLCVRPETVPGKRVCAQCYEKLLESQKRAAARSRAEHPWREANRRDLYRRIPRPERATAEE